VHDLILADVSNMFLVMIDGMFVLAVRETLVSGDGLRTLSATCRFDTV